MNTGCAKWRRALLYALNQNRKTAGKKQGQKQKAGFHENLKTGLQICNQVFCGQKATARRQARAVGLTKLCGL
jgi:hypothetical protein